MAQNVVLMRVNDWQNKRFVYYAMPKDRMGYLVRGGYITWVAGLDVWEAVCLPSFITEQGGTIVDIVDYTTN